MSRPLYQCPKVYTDLLKIVKSKIDNKKNKHLNLRIFSKSRNTILLPISLGTTFMVHNGKVFLKVFVSQTMIGHKLGEFSSTRARYIYKKTKKIKTKK